MRKCPRCMEKVQSAAQVCRHCGNEFTASEIKAAKSDETAMLIVKLLLACFFIFTVVRCASGPSYSPVDNSTQSQSDYNNSYSSAQKNSATPVAPAVDLSASYRKSSISHHCAERYPSDFAMRAACARNASAGFVDFVTMWNSYTNQQPVIEALSMCFARYTESGVTDFAMAGACARNQQRGLEELN